MSARGARSRKAVAKDIEKKEKKAAAKAYVDTMPRPNTAFSDWGMGSNSDDSRKTPTQGVSRHHILSGVSHSTSRSSSSHASGQPRLTTVDSRGSAEFRALYRPKTSASVNTSLSGSSNSTKDKEKEKAKYQKKGKETAAPRGRGGGVPLKLSGSQAPPPMRTESSASVIAAPPRKSWTNFKVWHGRQLGLRPYGGFEHDEDMQTGTVLIYFKEEQDAEDKPVSQIRADLEILKNSGSTWLSNALLYGKIEDYDDDDYTLPGSPEFTPTSHFSGLHPRQIMTPPPFNFDDAYIGPAVPRTMSRNQIYSQVEAFRDRHLSPSPFPQQAIQMPATHELWFAAPAHVRSPQAQRLHHVAVRNFLALLHNKPIVGTDLYEMLSTLQPEIEVMYDLDHDERSRVSSRTRSVQMITHYLSSRGLDDVRNGVKSALGLLAWAEQDGVKWQQGYLESFVHLAGIMSPKIEELPDFKRLSVVTRRNLGNAANALQLKIMEAEEKLSTFDFADMWEDPEKAIGNPVYKGYSSFRQFLLDFYSHMYGSWPPNRQKTWLNRKTVLSLQEDFGSLYDYLVNRDVVWDPREERPGKKWQMADKASPDDFETDTAELPLTDMLIGFDNRHGFLHIPHPYPLLPRMVQSAKAPAKKSLFSGLKKSKNDSNKDAKTHLQLSIVFSDATNIQNLGVSFTGSPLIDAFERYELSADLKGVSPRDARLGRWILLYGILQVLSQLSVDTKGLRFTDGVQYFLCADLKRCPSWVTSEELSDVEASQLRSWCWQRDWDETALKRKPRIVSELEGSMDIVSELYGRTNSTREANYERDRRTSLTDDIQRISEKIDNLGRPKGFDEMAEYEKFKGLDFGEAKRDGHTARELAKLKEFEFNRPQVPTRSPLRSPRPQAGYFDDAAF